MSVLAMRAASVVWLVWFIWIVWIVWIVYETGTLILGWIANFKIERMNECQERTHRLLVSK